MKTVDITGFFKKFCITTRTIFLRKTAKKAVFLRYKFDFRSLLNHILLIVVRAVKWRLHPWYENKIALCKACHNQQDYHTTVEDYLKLLKIKQRFLQLTDLHEATLTMGLEPQIADVVTKVCFLREDEATTLNYMPVRLTKISLQMSSHKQK